MLQGTKKENSNIERKNMSNQEEKIVMSFLPTCEDYCDFKLAACHAATQKKEVIIVRIVGFLLVLFGFVGRFFWQGGFYRNAIFSIMVLIGMIMGFYFDSFQPYFIKRSAISYFKNHQERIFSKTILFGKEKFEIQTDRYRSEFFYKDLYQVYENEKLFLFYIGIGEIYYLPKRSGTQDDCQKIKDILTQHLKENYRQEGVR